MCSGGCGCKRCNYCDGPNLGYTFIEKGSKIGNQPVEVSHRLGEYGVEFLARTDKTQIRMLIDKTGKVIINGYEVSYISDTLDPLYRKVKL